MRQFLARLTVLALLTAPSLHAQGSIFGVRGLGFPSRALTAKAIGTGGGLGMFEGESSRNPASLTLLTGTSTSFNSTTSWRRNVNPLSKGSNSDTRFPQMSVAGPIPGSKFAVGFSNSLFADRDFTIASEGVAVPRGEALLYTDSSSSRGGISDLRLTTAWHPMPTLAIGVGIDFLTGQNQLTTRRVWEDTLYLPTKLGGEVSFRSTGMTLGALYQPNTSVQLAGSAQYLGSLEVRQDSLDARSHIPMPMTLTAAIRVKARPSVYLTGMASTRNWSRSNDALLVNGGTGARSTNEFSGGMEWIRNAKSPDQLPVRIGVRSSKLPFALLPGGAPHETAFSAGTGFRFANQGGGLDFSLERITRKEGTSYSETAWHLTFGITVRASGGGR